MYLSMS